MYVRCKDHNFQHQDITLRTTTEVSHWQGQLYEITGIF